MMKMKSIENRSRRKCAVAALFAILLVPMIGLMALAIDYGYLLEVRAELQRVADKAALAAVRDLVPSPDGSQDLEEVRNTLRSYVAMNFNEEFIVRHDDIQMGRFNPATVYTSFEILDEGVFDTVRVTLRRDDLTDSSISLYFARVIGLDTVGVSASATAVLQKARNLGPGSDILPIAIPQDVWEAQELGDQWSIYGDGKIQDDNGNTIPGNWGTVDVGNTSNSTSDLVDQIGNGLRQDDLDYLHDNGVISTNDYIDSQEPMTVNGDTGLSSGIKAPIADSHGKTKLVPIYDWTNVTNGGGLDFGIVGWGVVLIVDSSFKGNKKSNVTIQKAYMYDSDLRPQTDLSDTWNVIENAFTAPALVQ